MEKQEILIVADGEPIGREQELAVGRLVVAVDGAANHLRKVGLIPDVILGDLDSLHDPDFWGVQRLFNQLQPNESPYLGKAGVRIVPALDQNLTDLAKAIEYCDRAMARSILMINVLGRRTDHLLHNLRLLRRYHRIDRELAIATHDEHIRYIKDCEIVLEAPPQSPCAILGFPEAVVTSKGLLYELSAHRLSLGHDSTSNHVRDQHAHLLVKGEALVIVQLSRCL